MRTPLVLLAIAAVALGPAAATAAAKEIAIEVDVDDALSVQADAKGLDQILVNLADNAVKYTRDGRVVLRAYASGPSVRIEVEDTGVGMSADTQRHVFDRFYRGQDRDAEGFGLGLAIVRQAVRSLEGRVELESAPGKGTLVRIELERARMRTEVPA